MITKERMIIAFNRREGGMDMQVAIDLTVEDTADNGRKTVSTKVIARILVMLNLAAGIYGRRRKASETLTKSFAIGAVETLPRPSRQDVHFI